MRSWDRKLYQTERVLGTLPNFESPWRSSYGRRTYFDKFVSQHLSDAGSSPAGSVGRDLNLQKLHYQYLTTSVAAVLVVR